MRVKYFAEDGRVFEIEAPQGTAVRYRAHKRDEAGAFLDDTLTVPWQGKRLGVDGEFVWKVAERGLMGLRIVSVIAGSHAPSRAPRP